MRGRAKGRRGEEGRGDAERRGRMGEGRMADPDKFFGGNFVKPRKITASRCLRVGPSPLLSASPRPSSPRLRVAPSPFLSSSSHPFGGAQPSAAWAALKFFTFIAATQASKFAAPTFCLSGSILPRK